MCVWCVYYVFYVYMGQVPEIKLMTKGLIAAAIHVAIAVAYA